MQSHARYARQLHPDDVTGWRRLRAEGLRLFPDAFLITAEEAAARTPAQDAGMLADGNGFGVFEGDRLLGIAVLRQLCYARALHRAEIGPFYITPSAQGTDAADLLMQTLVRHAISEGIWQLELYVAESGARARRFYQRHGFEVQGRVPNCIVTETGPADDLFCVRILPRP